MSSTTFPLKSLSRKRWLARISLVGGFVCLTLFGWVVNTTLAYAGEIPGGNISDPVVRKVDIARPAVVRIITTIGGRLTVRFAPTPQSATFPLNGGSYPLTLSGSGAFVSASGDILTADHVVNPRPLILQQQARCTSAQSIPARRACQNLPMSLRQCMQRLIVLSKKVRLTRTMLPLCMSAL